MRNQIVRRSNYSVYWWRDPRMTVEPAAKGGWIRRLWPFLMAHKRNVAIAFGVAVVGQAITALTPLVEKVIIDDVITHARPAARAVARAARSSPASSAFVCAYVRRFLGGRVASTCSTTCAPRSSSTSSGSTSPATTSCRPASSCRGPSATSG